MERPLEMGHMADTEIVSQTHLRKMTTTTTLGENYKFTVASNIIKRCIAIHLMPYENLFNAKNTQTHRIIYNDAMRCLVRIVMQ